MRVAKYFAAAAAIGLAGVASAAPVMFQGFAIDSRVLQGTGALAGKDIIQFFARNTGTGAQTGTSRLLSAELDVNASNNAADPATLTFDFRDLDFDGANDANIFGQGLSLTSTTVQGSYVRIGAIAQWQQPPGDAGFDPPPPARLSNIDEDPDPDIDPTQLYANRKSFRVVGFNTSQPPPLADATQNGGLGAFLAQAVVPHGSAARIVGGISAEQGNAVPIDYTVPEPGALGFIGLGVGLMVRRRRA